MSLQIIAGKPGSGKSYHCVTMILKHLEDWAAFEHREEKPFERVIYTNLPLQNQITNDYLSKKLGRDVEIGHYVKQIDENLRQEFRRSGQFPLAAIPQNALIVIDEVHKLFGAEMDGTKNKDFEINFRNYIAQHRHQGHDLIFLTQHTDNIAKSILAIADKLYQIENAKNYSFGFPLNIPFSDLDVIKEAFGIKTQYYTVSVGKYQGRRAKFDGETTRHLMSQEIFACYNSHTLSDITSDRPSLNLTPIGSLFWFAKKHAFHLGAKTIAAAFAVYIAIDLFSKMPVIITSALSSSLTPSQVVAENPKEEKKPGKKTEPPRPAPVTTSETPVADSSIIPEVPSYVTPPRDEKILAVHQNGVVTDNGRRRLGQTIIVDGQEEKLKVVNVRKGVLMFESGKVVTVPQ